jgi:FkbH-like protein
VENRLSQSAQQSPARHLEIAIVANFVATEIKESLNLWFENLSISASVTIGPFDSVIQQLLDHEGIFRMADFGVVLLQLEKWLPSDGIRDPTTALQNIDSLIQSIEAAVTTGRVVPFLVISCPHTPHQRVEDSIRLMEQRLRESLRILPNLEFLTTLEINSLYPTIEYSSYLIKGQFLSEDMPYSQLFFATLGTFVARRIYVRFSRPRKVIVVDCDNTLWTGNCGDLGPVGVKILSGNRALQDLLVQQSQCGKLICLCSRNNAADVLEVFGQHPAMILQEKQLSTYRINWDSKVSNLHSLSEELGLHLDSFIFLDDEEYECAQVQLQCPEVLTVLLPKDHAKFTQELLRIWDFDPHPTTKEDEQRALFYKQNAARDRTRRSGLSFEEFLSGLQLTVTISPLERCDIARVSQLMLRVNQFNLNGLCLTEYELRSLICSQTCRTIRVADRFGDYGLVGVLIYEASAEVLHVRSLLLSCRALGRGVEERLGVHLAAASRASQALYLEFDLRISPRNTPLRSFLAKLGVVETNGRVLVSRTIFSQNVSASSVSTGVELNNSSAR